MSNGEQVTYTQYVNVGGDKIAAFPFITTKCGFLFHRVSRHLQKKPYQEDIPKENIPKYANGDFINKYHVSQYHK